MRRDMSLDRLSDYSDESIFRELKRVAQLLGKDTLTISDVDTHARCSYASLKKRFGGLRPALTKAGLASPPPHRKLSDEELLNELARIWDIVLEVEGRRPYRTDLTKYHCLFSSTTYGKRWGSWIKACEALLERSVDDASPSSRDDKQGSIETPASTHSPHPKRAIPLKLRYDVLKRDYFRCVLCGRSPATHHGLKLHVDHIIPESAGGRTVMKNLRALCAECNIGRGAARDEAGRPGASKRAQDTSFP